MTGAYAAMPRPRTVVRQCRGSAMGEHRPEDVARFFDDEACCAPSRRPADGRPRGVSGVLLELLEDAGMSGRTVLDVGCGQGGLTLALGRRGARDVAGIDLSPASVAAAERAARQAGVPAHFRVANAAADTIGPHDVVVLNRVLCCWFDVDALLANTLPAAGSVVALSFPRSRGARGALARVFLAAENAYRRLRGDRFRSFVHDESAVMRALELRGWSPTARRDHWTWHVAVLEPRA